MRILLAEDDPVVRRSIVVALEASGHNVVAVGNGRQAVEAGRLEQFDRVITDLVMPEVSGLGVIESGHKEGWLRCPVVIMTAYSKTRMADIKGVVAVLPKPADPAAVVLAVEAAGKPPGTQ